MSEQITTAAELDAKSALMTKLCRVLGRDHVDAVHLDLVSALAGDDLWPLMMSFAASRRPDAPARTDPTEEQVAEAAHRGFCERRDGDLPNTFEKYDELDAERMAWWRSAARAVLALLPQRVAPSEEESDHA